METVSIKFITADITNFLNFRTKVAKPFFNSLMDNIPKQFNSQDAVSSLNAERSYIYIYIYMVRKLFFFKETIEESPGRR